MDHFIAAFDRRLALLGKPPPVPDRPYPAADLAMVRLNDSESHHSAALMRVNHAGEVAAQALYKAQAITARDRQLQDALAHSAAEEHSHLVWCKTRLQELNGASSYLDPMWFAGSFAIGIMAGLCGDQYSLGFIMETEHQVVVHLDRHLETIAANDIRSRAIIEKMRADEAHHATTAYHAGAPVLPPLIKNMMRRFAKVMTTTAYYI